MILYLDKLLRKYRKKKDDWSEDREMYLFCMYPELSINVSKKGYKYPPDLHEIIYAFMNSPEKKICIEYSLLDNVEVTNSLISNVEVMTRYIRIKSWLKKGQMELGYYRVSDHIKFEYFDVAKLYDHLESTLEFLIPFRRGNLKVGIWLSKKDFHIPWELSLNDLRNNALIHFYEIAESKIEYINYDDKVVHVADAIRESMSKYLDALLEDIRSLRIE